MGHKDAPEVLIVGPYPPPLGGVSSHVQRATAALRRAGHTVAVLNHFAARPAGTPVIGSLHRNPLLYFTKLRKARAGVVHYHHAGRPSLLLAAALARRPHDASRWLITLHNHSLERHLRGGLSAALTRWALGRFDQVVAVSSEIGKFLADHQVETPTVVLAAYVRSQTQSPAGRDQWVPRPFFAGPGITLVASAYRVVRFGAGGDLYGLDLAAETFAVLAEERADLRLAIFLSHPPRGRWAKRHLDSILRSFAPERRERVGIWVGEQLPPAFGPNVVYLRPTQTDGDAVGVREALDRGVPVLASDCTARPEGVATAPHGDPHAWRVLVKRTLAELEERDPLVSAPLSESLGVGERDVLRLYEPHLATHLEQPGRR